MQHYNQQVSQTDPPVTTIGYMPMILNPAHEYDTLNTVITRCRHVAETLGQKYVVITADEALFCRLMELKCSQDDYSFLIPRLGGLHTSMNFMKVIGQHFQGSGLLELWTESDLLGSRTAERVLLGKDYEKAMRAHKLTCQAMWELLAPHLIKDLDSRDKDLGQQISKSITDKDYDQLFITQHFRETIISFVDSKSENPNFALWWGYLEMVSTLLMFTRAQRDGNWDLHFSAFKKMLPFFFQYDHLNYAKWGSVYLAEMNMLPGEIIAEFKQGKFVVKATKAKFNQVDGDQAQEWLNGTGKKGGGFVGIARNITSLSRWALSFNMRSQISRDTKEMFNVTRDESGIHKEANMSRRKRDTEDEAKLLQKLKFFGVFSKDSTPGQPLRNIVTKDQATHKITESLVGAKMKGQLLMHEFVTERLVANDDGDTKKKFSDPMIKTIL